MITIPTSYVELESKYGIANIASLVRQSSIDGIHLLTYGGVIACLSARKDIRTLEDIRGKTVVATHSDAFAGMLVQRTVLSDAGIHISNDNYRMLYTGQPQDKVLEALKSKKADVGFFRTGYMEELITKGKLKQDEIFVINSIHDNYPYLHSTPLYPEWAVAATKCPNSETIKKVTIALYQITSNTTKDYHEFSAPLSYDSTRALMKRYNLYPYEKKPPTLKDVISVYALHIMLSLILLLIVVILAFLKYRKKAESDLYSKNQLENILKTASDGIHIHDLDGNVILCNEAFANELGYTLEEMRCLNVSAWEVRFSLEELKVLWRDFPHSSQRFDTLHRRKDGSVVNVDVLINKIQMHGKDYIYASSRDITTQKEQELELQKKQNFISSILNNSAALILVLDIKGIIVHIDETLKRVTGFSKDELIGKRVWDVLIPRDEEASTVETFNNLIIEHVPNYHTNHMYKKDGSLILVEWSNSVVLDENSNSEYVIATGIDITEQSKLNAVVEQQRTKYKYILESSTDGIHIVDSQGKFVELSNSFASMLGYSKDELYNLTIFDIDSKMTQFEIDHAMKESVKTSLLFESLHRRKDGTDVVVQINARGIEIDGERYIYASARDITEKKKQEQLLQEQKDEFESIFKTSVDGIAIMDLETRFLDCNDAYLEMTGLTKSEMLNASCLELTAPEHIKKTKDAIEEVIKNGYVRGLEKACIINERKLFVNISLTLLPDKQRILAMSKDITKQKRIQEELDYSYNLVKSIINTVQTRIFWKDKNLNYLGCNNIFANDAGKSSPLEVIGRSDYDMGWAEQADLYRADDKAVIDSDTSKISYVEPQTTPDGKIIWLSTSKIPLKDNNGNIIGILGTYDDVTYLKENELALIDINLHLNELVQDETTKRLEKEKLLLQQSKMAMMGEMIGAIAHQWRQPLNSLGLLIQNTNVAYMFDELNEEKMNTFSTNSMSIIHRMSKTIDDFRDFFKPNKEKSDFCAEEAVQSTIHIMEPMLKNHGIALNYELASKHLVFGYQNELEQAVMIIISNAQDALLENKIEEPKIDISIQNIDDNKIMLSIHDNAGGVPEDIIDRIFEPYFTTKEQGKGTGIGLYMAKEIVERQMGGRLYVQNVDGGARFVIEI